MNSNTTGRETLYAALNPRGIKPEVKEIPLGPRVPDLNGKVVYCISQTFGGADIFLQKVAEALPHYAPGVRAKAGDTKATSPLASVSTSVDPR